MGSARLSRGEVPCSQPELSASTAGCSRPGLMLPSVVWAGALGLCLAWGWCCYPAGVVGLGVEAAGPHRGQLGSSRLHP